MPSNLDIPALRTLITIADSGGFGRAGERLHLTQSAVSQQMKRLEEQMQVTLFNRRGRGVVLTAAGETVVSFARRIIDINDEVIARISGERRSTLLRIGLPEHFAESCLPRLLGLFSKEMPDGKLDVRIDLSQRLIEATDAGDLDLAVVLCERGKSRDSVIRQEPVIWMAAEDYEPNPDIPVPLVLFDGPCLFRRMVLQSLESEKIPWRNVYDSPSFASMRAAVRAKLGITGLLRQCMAPGLRTLEPQPGLPELPYSEIAIHFPPGQPTPAVKHLAELASAIWSDY